ncbi:hypothetical protein DL770_010609 [Monosporascus sp. CRB-9-2]|nr:hypothetical protein DL770_010609 [Monosporascus sp. CRB-9-2]
MNCNSKRPADVIASTGTAKKPKSTEEGSEQLPQYPNPFSDDSSVGESDDNSLDNSDDDSVDDLDEPEETLALNDNRDLALAELISEAVPDDPDVESEFILDDSDYRTICDDNSGMVDARREVLNHLGISTKARSWAAILFELIEDETLKPSIKQFVRKIHSPEWTRGKSKEDVDEFLTTRHRAWADHDPAVTTLWDDFRAKLGPLLESAPEKMVGFEDGDGVLAKPSGPLHAILACIWHYPTFRTNKPYWGHVLDKSNAFLNLQYRKTGPSRSILTLDQIPMRKEYSKDAFADFWSNPDWRQISDLCMEFSRELSKRSPLLMLLGKDNFYNMERLVQRDPCVEILKARIRLDGIRIFGGEPSIYIIRNVDTKEIHQLVFVSYHLQWIFQCTSIKGAAYHDLLWNAALSFGGLDIAREDNFSRLVSVKADKKNSGSKGIDLDSLAAYTPLRRALTLRMDEIEHGYILPESSVRALFSGYYQANPELTERKALGETGSYLSRLLSLWTKNGAAKRRDPEWRASPAARKYIAAKQRWADLRRRRLLETNYECSFKIARLRARFRAITKTRQFVRLREKGSRPRQSYSDWLKSLAPGHPSYDLMAYYLDHVAPIGTSEAEILECIERTLTVQWATIPDRKAATKERNRIINAHVIFYSNDYPHGLRWVGDGGPDSDDFPYEEQDHPAVNFERVLTDADRNKLRPEPVL